MSLRVLLADESASIRKVFQLGLQDYSADVKSVHNGLDVIQVAEQFQPDIIFADILLQKKDGYQVSQEINGHAQLSHVPVVLMWSSFMELDQKKYKDCQAQGEMEKPFEVDVMRSHIEKLVETAKSQQLSQFLSFPESIKNEFVEEEREEISEVSHIPPPPDEVIVDENISYEIAADSPASVDEPEETTSVFNMQAGDAPFDAELETAEGDAPLMPPETQRDLNGAPMTSIEDSWETKALGDNSIEETPTKEDDQDLENFKSMELNTAENLKLDDFLYKPKEDGLAPLNESTSATTLHTPPTESRADEAPTQSITKSEIEAIVLAHTQEVIKLNIQEQLPRILEKVVREELEKLLQQELALKAGPP